MHSPRLAPSWDALFETARLQQGHFTTRQAAQAGYSPQLLLKHVRAGRVRRVQRGIYRLVHFPEGGDEALVAAWLWTGQAGVASHQTALRLHGLSHAPPTTVHLTLPWSWKRRRLRVPAGVALHHADVPARERARFGPVPATSVRRTLDDCAGNGGALQSRRRGRRSAAAEKAAVAERGRIRRMGAKDRVLLALDLGRRFEAGAGTRR